MMAELLMGFHLGIKRDSLLLFTIANVVQLENQIQKWNGMSSRGGRGEKAVNLVLLHVIFLPAQIGSLISNGNETLPALTFHPRIQFPRQLVHWQAKKPRPSI
jgi:hypothetical protein